MRKLLPGLVLIVLSLAAPIAAAETIDVSDDHGGSVAAYNQRWQQYAARGVNVRIVGPVNRLARYCWDTFRAPGFASRRRPGSAFTWRTVPT